jgi:hypothetical protein
VNLPVISVTLAAASCAISLLVAARNWRYSERGVRVTSRGQILGALFDMDRQLIAYPELWAIFDGHFMASKRNDTPDSQARRHAFIYYNYNLFEAVYNDYNHAFVLSARDKQYWAAWESYIRQFMRSSSESRRLFQDTAQELFGGDFRIFMNGIISDCGLLEPSHHPRPSAFIAAFNAIHQDG